MSQEFLDKVLADVAAGMGVALAFIGEKLGLYRALAAEALTSAELAAKTETSERLVREWLIHQAACGYLTYDPATARYALPTEHVPVLADEASPLYAGGGFQAAVAMVHAESRITEAFRTGAGMAWGEHTHDLSEGVGRFFRANYLLALVPKWMPQLDGVVERLRAGGTVADIGCGLGYSTLAMARAFPASKFIGFDSHGPSLAHARELARREGVTNASYVETTAEQITGGPFDLIAYFNTFHDLGEPVLAAKTAFAALKDDGVIMLVEPIAGDRTEDNFNTVGQIFAASSVLCCTPHQMATGTIALGTIPTDAELRRQFVAAGFTRFKRVAQSKTNRVIDVRR